MKRLLEFSPLIGMVVLTVMGLLAESKAERWREVAYEGVEAATSCRRQLKEQIAFCTEDINERSNHLKDLSDAFCRERVPGCQHVESVTRRANGVYECRCIW